MGKWEMRLEVAVKAGFTLLLLGVVAAVAPLVILVTLSLDEKYWPFLEVVIKGGVIAFVVACCVVLLGAIYDIWS